MSCYSVWIDYAGDHTYIDCDTLVEAIQRAQEVTPARYKRVHVIGDGAEGGYGDDGTGWWDGLTNEERELVEEAGL
jgi:hypothetical protein